MVAECPLKMLYSHMDSSLPYLVFTLFHVLYFREYDRKRRHIKRYREGEDSSVKGSICGGGGRRRNKEKDMDRDQEAMAYSWTGHILQSLDILNPGHHSGLRRPPWRARTSRHLHRQQRHHRLQSRPPCIHSIQKHFSTYIIMFSL